MEISIQIKPLKNKILKINNLNKFHVKHNCMKILLVRLSSMGDLIHTFPAIEDLAKHRPDIELHWLCEEGFSDIAKLHPFVKKIHKMSWRKWRKDLHLRQTWQEIGCLKFDLKQEQFDFVLDSQGLIKSAVFAKMANAPVYGFDKNSIREKLASVFYSKSYSVSKNQNAVLRNRQLFSKVFEYGLSESELQIFGLSIPAEVSLNGLNHPYCVMLHASSKDSKLWPIENWKQLLKTIYADKGISAYLPWGNSKEKERAEQIAEGLQFAVVCEKMNLLQAAFLLKNAQGVIGVDTGLLHLANALDCPVVGIYTDTDPMKTGVQVSEYAKNVGNIGNIPEVDEVYRGIFECISAKRLKNK